MNATGTADTTALKKGSNGSNGSSSNGSSNGASRSDYGSSSTSSSKEEKQTSLKKIFEDGLLDIYSAELQLIKALPDVAKACYTEELEDAIKKHLEQTKKQAERLEKIFDRLGIEVKDKKCEAMKGLIEENEKVLSEFKKSPARDSAIIIGSQKIEHYEIASYGSLVELAEVLGYQKVADMLDRTLQEEGDTDHLLTDLAMDINDEALEMEIESSRR